MAGCLALGTRYDAPMPELAEVEFYRKQWASGVGEKVREVWVRSERRVFRGTDVSDLRRAIRGARLASSAAGGKQMLFGFSSGCWLGVHLGMTGKLGTTRTDHVPAKHDQLVLYQAGRALVFSDPRQFGRVRFERGKSEPAWWREQPPALISASFTVALMERFLRRHGRLPVKAALLLQAGFPGIGNWMADEVLWRSGLHPRIPVGQLAPEERRRLYREVRFVCRAALRTVGRDDADPPARWLFHERWSKEGKCPRHGQPLSFDTVGGRTTAWCAICQER